MNANAIRHYIAILGLIASSLVRAETIASWGDSLSISTGGTSWPDQFSTLSGMPVFIGGVGGESSTQIRARMTVAQDHFGQFTVIWAGRNNFTQRGTVLDDVAAMVSSLTTTRYLVLGVINADIAGVERKNESGWVAINALNAQLQASYKEKYVDIRTILVKAYNPASASDVADFANDVPPTSLRSDPIHLNTAGYGVVAKAIYEKYLQSEAPSRIVNLSVLTSIASAGDSFSMGYVVGGKNAVGTKPVLIRAAGPSLTQLGVSGALVDPKLETFVGPVKSGENDNWGGSPSISSAMFSVGAFPYAGPASLDAAVSTNIAQGDNSVKVSAVNSGVGTVIAEVYDATDPARFVSATPRIINVSVLKNIGSGLTVGFVVVGATPKNVLIRAIGPTLGSSFGIVGAVPNPQLVLFGPNQTKVAENDDWGGGLPLRIAFATVGAFNVPTGSQDAMVMTTLNPGSYTVFVSGVNGSSGLALVEVYDMP